MPLDLDDLMRITREVVLGLEPKDTSPEAEEARRRIKRDVLRTIKAGGIVDLPCSVWGEPTHLEPRKASEGESA